ncbi:MAG: MMPL family transporter, partial [Casimicrobiaceae bacterium]
MKLSNGVRHEASAPGSGRTWLPIAIWIGGLAACIAIIAHTRFTADLSAFLPRAPTAEQRVLVDQLRDGAVSRLLLIGIEGGDAATRARISKALGDELRRASEFSSVHNGDAKETALDRDYFFANRYLLSPTVTAARFTTAGLRAAIGESIDLLASPAGMMLKSVLPRDPTGEIVALIGELDGGSRPPLTDGVWSSKDGARAILLAQTSVAGSDIDAQQHAQERVRSAFAAQAGEKSAQSTQLRLLMTGPGVFAVRSRATIQHEVLRLALLSTAIIVTLLLAIYRSPTALGLGLLPVASGALAAVAAVSLGFGEVHGLTL